MRNPGLDYYGNEAQKNRYAKFLQIKPPAIDRFYIRFSFTLNDLILEWNLRKISCRLLRIHGFLSQDMIYQFFVSLVGLFPG